MIKLFVVCNILVLTVNSAFAGAIAQVMGLKMGESLSSIKSKGVKLTPGLREYMYNATNLPQPARIVPEVLLVIHPRFGLCTIIASSVTHDDNAFGTQTRSVYEGLRTSLASKYNEPSKSFDFVRAGSTWNAEQYFMMGLETKERSLMSFWMKADGARLPQGIQAIQLKANALSPSRGYVNVKYESDFHGECVNARKSNDAIGL